ncbi:MAG: thioredoxin domain-containing protein [Deltaproteobacteria bacterium]|nr:MAG: thioredoxin domain-containing protein [Deltaproteobacteria bacterium]
MAAAMAMGLGGGWPLNVFCTPDLEPFYAVTYLPEKAMLQLLQRIDHLWRTERPMLIAQGRQVVDALSKANLPGGAGEFSMTEAELARVVGKELGIVDPEWGGILGRAKFPTPARWHFLLHLWRRNGDDRARGMVEKTLENMASGALFDQIGGGFHRYCIDRDWRTPHFEKMLYDNALLAALYTEAAVALDRPDFGEVAARTLDFMIDQMQLQQGGFASSIDAESEQGEGVFYAWTPQQVLDLAGSEDGEVLLRHLGLEAGGAFGGGAIPTRRNGGGNEASEVFRKWRPALLAERQKRPRPPLDEKVITAWNGMAIVALVAGYRAFRDDRYLDAALKANLYLANTHSLDGGAVARASNDGLPSGTGALEDYAWWAEAQIELFQATGDVRHSRGALELAASAVERFSEGDGGFRTYEAEGLSGAGNLAVSDMPTPSAVSVMAHLALDLYELTADSRWLERARKLLGRYQPLMERGGLDLAWMYDAALFHLAGKSLAVVAGTPEQRRHFIGQLAARLYPQLILAQVPAGGAHRDIAGLLPALSEKRAKGKSAQAFLCTGVTCTAATSDPAELEAKITRGWRH